MTGPERQTLVQGMEKPWYGSKKFLAFLFMEVILTALAGTALFTQPELGWPLAAFMLGIVLNMGFIALAFNGKQATLDMYVRAMALTGSVPDKLAKQYGTVKPPQPDFKANTAISNDDYPDDGEEV